MWFLLLQIFILLLIAAALGAAIAFWWIKRGYEDVTESHADLLHQARQVEGIKLLATREEIDAGLSGVMATVSSLQMPDLDPVQDRIAQLESTVQDRIVRLESAVQGLTFPVTDLDPLTRQLELVEVHLRAPNVGLEQMRTRMGALEESLVALTASVAALKNADLQPVETRLAGIEGAVAAWKAPEVDLGPVHSGIAALGLGLQEMKASLNPDPLHDRIAGMAADLQRAIAGIVVPETDLRPVQTMLVELSGAVSALDQRPIDADLQNRFAVLQESLGAVQAAAQMESRRALEPIQRGVAGMQEALQGLPGPDLSPLMDAVISIDSRQDLAAVENRLTAIEYSLAALHHMMRSRTESGATRVETTWQVRPGGTPPVNGNGVGQETRNGSAAPTPPPREHDPINPVRKPGETANLLVEAAFGPPDDLSQINGVGPILSQLLNDTGVYYFWQVAEWSPDDAAAVDDQLMYFKGRIKRDDWIGHARKLAVLPTSARRPSGH